MNAIFINAKKNRAQINSDECVECGICLRGMSMENLNPVVVRLIRKISKIFRFRFEPEPDICPTSSFEMNKLEMPRLIRQIFSDPVVVHTSTGVKGRGTEEIKTNDVSSRVEIGEVGFTIELGRPGVGVRFKEIQEVTRNLARLGVFFEKNNPITNLMIDRFTGDLKDDILDEKIISAIIEVKADIEMVEKVLYSVHQVNQVINTVTVVGISTRCNQQGHEEILYSKLSELDRMIVRSKTNLGLGRITNEKAQRKEQELI